VITFIVRRLIATVLARGRARGDNSFLAEWWLARNPLSTIGSAVPAPAWHGSYSGSPFQPGCDMEVNGDEDRRKTDTSPD
jgi:hypothetical protein